MSFRDDSIASGDGTGRPTNPKEPPENMPPSSGGNMPPSSDGKKFEPGDKCPICDVKFITGQWIHYCFLSDRFREEPMKSVYNDLCVLKNRLMQIEHLRSEVVFGITDEVIDDAAGRVEKALTFGFESVGYVFISTSEKTVIQTLAASALCVDWHYEKNLEEIIDVSKDMGWNVKAGLVLRLKSVLDRYHPGGELEETKSLL